MTNEELWQAVLGEIELSLSKASFTTWFKNTYILRMTQDAVVVAVPNIFAKEWLEKKYKQIVLSSIRRHMPSINNLSCIISGKKEAPSLSIDSVVNGRPSDSLNQPANSDFSQKIIPNWGKNPNWNHFESNLKSHYCFENFVVGSNNELAYAACRAVADQPGKNYNPLFIYGGVGLGKTHLLQSTGNTILRQSPNSKIRYISMERFASALLDALQNQKVKEFKNLYMSLDVLILDDVQFLSGKEKTQEEFFHVFESLYQVGKQIILSSDRPPKSIPTLEDRLRSRFEGGMMADIGKPDMETRTAIIKKKLNEKDFDLNDEIVLYLAQNIYHNVREIEGALNKIIATFRLKNQEPNLNEAIEITKDVISTNRQKDLTPDRIIQSVAEFFEVKPDEIMGHCRKKKLVRPRQITIYFIRQEINLSFPEIGKIIGGRDHSTAIYAYEKIKEEIDKNELLKNHIKFIREKFIDY